MRLLLLSNSTSPGREHLAHATDWIADFLGSDVRTVAFVPYAGIRFSYTEYAAKVQARFGPLGYTITSVHETDDPVGLMEASDAVAVGGGNTFHLLHELYRFGLVEAIQATVEAGKPYIGWSAGSNMACPTLCTTNDMPIIEPPSFRALNLIPFQINPHYTDAHPPGHQGETRSDRIEEFLEVNPLATVVGLPEGTAMRREEGTLTLLGRHPLRLFQHGHPVQDLSAEADFTFLLAD